MSHILKTELVLPYDPENPQASMIDYIELKDSKGNVLQRINNPPQRWFVSNGDCKEPTLKVYTKDGCKIITAEK